jgi:hypothetical protein
MKFDPFGLSVKDLATRRVLARYNSTCPLYTLPQPPLPRVLLPSPPDIVALVTLGPMSSKPSSSSPITCPQAEMIPFIMPASLVDTFDCPFLASLLKSFDPLTLYTVTSGPPLF